MLNFYSKKVTDPKGGSGIGHAFSVITANDGNIFHKFNSDVLPEIDKIMHGRVVNLSIPPGFSTPNGKIINDSPMRVILQVAIDLKPGECNPSKAFDHFCEAFPLNKGTACAEFLQKPIKDAAKSTDGSSFLGIAYFKTENTNFPSIIGNKFLNKKVQKYNGKTIYYVPTITPNQTIIYVATTNENTIKKLISAYASKNQHDYNIALNGWIIFIDHWDSFFYFEKPKIAFLER